MKKMKKKKMGILIVIAMILMGCTTKPENKDALKFKEEYEALNGVETSTPGAYYREIQIVKNNPIVYTTFKEVKEKIANQESFLLYVGFSACPWCRTVIPYILEEANENNIAKIYYINVREDNTKESDLRGYYTLDDYQNVIYDIYPDKYYHSVLNTLDAFLTPYTILSDNKEIETGENRLYAPSLIAYQNGNAIALDTCISEKQKNGYQELDEEIIFDIKEKANTLFQKYKNMEECSDKSCK